MSESDLREQIQRLVVEYYEKFHRPKNATQFAETGRIPYAGRVYDSHEMLNLTDAMLDFWLTAGRYCDQFEKEFAQFLGLKHALLVNSGSSANLVAFQSLTSHLHGADRLQKGDEVITVAAGFPTTVAPILQFGCVPVFVDVRVEDGTYNIDCDLLEKALSSKTKAIMVAHTLGNPFDLERVTEFCQRHGLWLVEDNCDALGSTYEGKLTGTFGDVATSSFYPPHHMTMGEGGAVYTQNTTIKRAAESFRDWGRDCWCASGRDNTCKKRFGWKLGSLPEGYDHKYIYSHLGYNLKATEMQASIGCAQLKKLPDFVQKRKANFAFLKEALADLESTFVLPNATPQSDPSWFGFLLTVREGAPFSRNEVVKFLEEHKIQTRMLFAGNLIRHPAFDDLRGTAAYRVVGNLEQTDRLASRTFWLGVYPGLSSEMLKTISDRIHEFVRSK